MRRKDRNVSDFETIERIIMTSDVCRIAMTDGKNPYIVPMNFGYSGYPQRVLYFHCANEGKKIDMIKNNSWVCFEMDIDHQLYRGKHSCDWGMRYSSVIGYGNIYVLIEKEAKLAGLNCIMEHYGATGSFSYDNKVFERTTILRLDIEEITGKKC